MTAGAHPRYPRAFAEVFGARMAYVDVGGGDPIVFLHGNPTSSYLWRNVMPYLEATGRLIAPDLIGMGDSAKLRDSGPDRYTFVEHRRYLDELLDQLGVSERVTLVGHDWGGALAFDWANRYRHAVKGIAYMETIVRPLMWSDWPESHRGIFQAFRSPAGEELILSENIFVESVLPSAVLRTLKRRGAGSLPTPVRRARRRTTSDPHLATPDSHRRRTGRCRRDRFRLRQLALVLFRAEAVHQRRAGRHHHWQPA
jgi:haloalkane dehalogenase